MVLFHAHDSIVGDTMTAIHCTADSNVLKCSVVPTTDASTLWVAGRSKRAFANRNIVYKEISYE